MFIEPLESRTLLSTDTLAGQSELPPTRVPVEVHLDVASDARLSSSDTLLAAGAPRDLIFDPTRHQLLDIEADKINRYDATDGSLIDSISIGHSLGGGDITADGKFLYVSELGSHSIYKVDLQTVEYSSILVSDYLGTPIDIAIGGDYAIISQAYQASGDNILKLNLSDDSISYLWWEDVGPYGPARASLAARSADYSYVSLSSALFDASYVNDYLTGKALGHFGSVSSVAVSRDGTLHAIADSDSITVLDSNFTVVRTFPYQNGGVAFDRQRDYIYLFDQGSDWVLAYDTHSWELLLVVPTTNFPQPTTDPIVMTSGDEGEVFLATPSGIHHIELSHASPFGVWLTLKASITSLEPVPFSPGGLMSFIDKTTGDVIGARSIPSYSNLVTMRVDWLTGGHHSVLAHYEGDDNFEPADSAEVPFDVARAATFVRALFSDDNEVTVSALSISQVPATPTGSIVIKEAEKILATGTLKDGYVTLPLLLPDGSHTLTISYSGDSNFLPAVNTSRKIIPQNTVTTLAGPAAGKYGARSHFVATVHTTSNEPVNDGVVLFKEGSRVVGTVEVQNSRAFIDLYLSAGMHQITAYYQGADEFRQSVSSPLNIQVARGASAVRLKASSDFIAAGKKFNLIATVDPGPTYGEVAGNVTFKDGTRILGRELVADGVATLSVSLPRGTHKITATFSGTSDYNPSTSSPVSTTVVSFTTVDLMIVYTQQAVVSSGSLPGLQRTISDSVADINTAFANSRIPVIIRLVHTEQVNYRESGKLETDLKRLTLPHDGFMDSVHAARNSYGADLVSLFESDGDLGGVGWELRDLDRPDSTLGFSVVLASQAADPYYTLAHELGHNFGATHDSEHAEHSGATAFSNGWRFRGKNGVLYHDIMSYDPGHTIPYFSNPRIRFNGVPTGNAATADSARTITLAAPVVASYRRVLI